MQKPPYKISGKGDLDMPINNVDILGVFEVDEIGFGLGNRRSAFVNNVDELQFPVRPLSNVPDSCRADEYTVFAGRIQQYFMDDRRLSDTDRVERLQQFLRDKVVIFNVEVQRRHEQTFHTAHNVRVYSKSEGFRSTSTFKAVPVFSARHDRPYESFKRRLLEKKPIGRVDNIATEQGKTPDFILWRHEDSSIEVFGEFKEHLYVYGGYQLMVGQENMLKHVGPSTPDWLDDAYEANDTVMFTPYEDYQAQLRQLRSEEAAQVTLSHPVTLAGPEPRDIPALEEDQGVEETPASTEIQFLNHFRDVTRAMGLQYEEKDLCNFHVSMKSSTLTILAGLSGTGKSRLVQAYARALGRRHNLVFIPVRPSWTDDADLLGYADLMHLIYRPADSGLINTLIEAARPENQDKFFIICFDEMNLARVEHYFSQFLSVLEQEPNDRRLRLYNQDLKNRLYNSTQYPPDIDIGDNVLFVGTVNLDESTYHFSDKVLDRANVIQLDVLPFQELRSVQPRSVPEIDWLGEVYGGFRNFDDAFGLTETELNFLWALHEEMQKVAKGIGIGPRTVRQIDLYIKNVPSGASLTRDDAWDKLICQRILTKLRGQEELLTDLIRHDAQPDRQGTLLPIFEQYATLSDFTQTRSVLEAKWKEVQSNGYTV